MKLRWLLIITLSILLLAACQQTEHPPTPTGYNPGEISQPQIMYNDVIYYYNWTGFDEELPDNYKKVGTVIHVNNIDVPNSNFYGARVELGQEIYYLDDKPDCIYVKYESGFARFVINASDNDEESP